MTFPYRRGYTAALRCRSIGRFPHCPYEGHDDISFAMQQDFMTGVFDALTLPRRRRKRRVWPRRAIRKRWPRNEYVRRRLLDALLS